jgi:cytochrome c peroxidase
MYRTTPLRALQRHPPYFHNGIAPTLDAVVDLYDTKMGLGLTAQQKADLVQYLKSL